MRWDLPGPESAAVRCYDETRELAQEGPCCKNVDNARSLYSTVQDLSDS